MTSGSDSWRRIQMLSAQPAGEARAVEHPLSELVEVGVAEADDHLADHLHREGMGQRRGGVGFVVS